MTARFILTFDCEGKWGVADVLDQFDMRLLSDESLQRAYSSIVGMLDQFQVLATFAFVGLFGERKEEFTHLRGSVERLARRAPHYLRPALYDIDRGGEGWHGPWAVDLVCGADQDHEIALHGITHVPWGTVDGAFIEQELALFGSLTSPVAAAKTFVFPRNDVGHEHILGQAGMLGYRLAPADRGRAAALLSEFNVRTPSQGDPVNGKGPIRIPAGYFVNWQSGLRRTVPKRVSEMRFAHMLDHAERTNGVVHMWLHPENVATAPATLDLLGALLRQVAERREQGRCHILRQIDYVAERRADLTKSEA
jgi:hypothetical protein